MTDTEAKALALVNDTARAMEGLLTLHPVDHVYYTELPKLDVFANALCRAIEREEATEARHAAELREQAERFSEVAVRAKGFLKDITQVMMMTRAVVDEYDGLMADLTPFIFPAPDPLVEVIAAALREASPFADDGHDYTAEAKVAAAAVRAHQKDANA